MRVAMIHAIAESIAPVNTAFGEVFPEAEVVNLLDEGLFLDFDDHITPALRRRMSGLICYGAEHGANAVGLACSVYAPVVDSACDLVDVPLVSSYGPVVEEALDLGRRVGVIASVPATLRDAEYYLRRSAAARGIELEPHLALAEDLIPVIRSEGVAGLERRLVEEVEKLAPDASTWWCWGSSPSPRRTRRWRRRHRCRCCQPLTVALGCSKTLLV